LGDLIGYLKQIPPVDSDYPPMSYGPILAPPPAVGLFTPMAEQIRQGAPRPADPVPSATIEYGRYLSALCTQCHSQNFSGKLAKWKQAEFVRAVRTGVLPDGKRMGTAMPLNVYGKMNDTELAALWLYLQDQSPEKAPK
jgi:hypothetical protein